MSRITSLRPDKSGAAAPLASLHRRHFLRLAALAPGASLASPALPPDLRTPHKIGRHVVWMGEREGDFASQGADCPFVFRHRDLFYMTYVGFDGAGYQTGLASSANLTTWRKEGVILPHNPASPVIRHNAALTWILRENDVFSPGALKQVNGRYLGVYHAYPSPGYEEGPAAIGLCWSSNLRDWQIEEPCLHASTGAAWERGGLYKACLLERDGTYYLFYNAKNSSPKWKEQIGYATSTDLKTWTRYRGNPVLRNGGSGSMDERFASDPCVLRYRDQWALFYYGLDKEGVARDLLALSPKLRRFTRCEGALIDVGAPGSVDSRYAHKPSVIFHDGVLYHFYCAVSREYGRAISVAASRPF